MEEIISGLERNDVGMQQKRIAHVRFFAELFNYFIVDTNLLFDTLYLLITYANDPRSVQSGLMAKLDSPTDCFRVRLVCTILDTCGHCFNNGGKSAKRLDKFLVIFQRYILAKEEVPADVVFSIEDTFDAIRPGMKRFSSLAEADTAIVAMLSEEQRLSIPKHLSVLQKKPTSAPAPAATVQPKPIDEEDEDDDEDDEDEDEEELETPPSPSSSEDEEEDESSEGDSDFGDDSEEEEEEEDIDEEEDEAEIKKKKKEEIPVDEEFDKNLAKIIQDSMDTVRQQCHKREPLSIVIPVTAAGPHTATTTTTTTTDDDVVPFTILLKKGTKQKTKEILVPIDSSLVQAAQVSQQQATQEKMELKRLVLESLATEQEEMIEEQAIVAPGTLGATMFVRYGRGGRGRGSGRRSHHRRGRW
jgi:regulator of nonsense transcripts 2